VEQHSANLYTSTSSLTAAIQPFLNMPTFAVSDTYTYQLVR